MEYIVVTGASGGIGKAAVLELLNNGFGVWAVGRNAETLEAEFSGYGNVRIAVVDYSEENSIKEFVAEAVKTTGPIRGFVHCAGFDKLAPLYLAKRKDIQALMDIHVYAAMDFCKYLAKKGNASEGCSIILFSSMSSHEGALGHSAYAAAKGALEGFLPSAAAELAEKKIRLNELILGVVETNMSSGFIGKMSEEQRNALDLSYPLGIGRPEDVSGMISFLISEKSSWITGQKFVLDGGHSVRRV